MVIFMSSLFCKRFLAGIKRRMLPRTLTVILSIVYFNIAIAEEILIAVASNFARPAQEIVDEFEMQTGHEVRIVLGSSGRIFAQISNGAPFHIFMSADASKPAALINAGLASGKSRFTYATGALVLWSNLPDLIVDGPGVLESQRLNSLALANPRVAPYGQAAVEVLENLGLRDKTESKWVQGENIAQTFQFVESGNAELGFVALAQVADGRGWQVPPQLHQPIQQDVVLLNSAAESIASREFMEFLRSSAVREIIRSYGYGVE